MSRVRRVREAIRGLLVLVVPLALGGCISIDLPGGKPGPLRETGTGNIASAHLFGMPTKTDLERL